MIKVFRWWWAWDYERIEDWLEQMELHNLRLVDTSFWGTYFHFERCSATKARYCIDYQTKLTPEYLEIINDDGWRLYQVGAGWYILRKEYEDEIPNLYTDFEGLIARNKSLLSVIALVSIIEILAVGSMIWDTYKFYSVSKLAFTCILGSVIIALFAFIITNLMVQISKFNKKE
jgi:hypothetical protein